MTLDEVFLHREWSYTLLRAGVGMCGALIVYFFLRSEFMDGALFPKFPNVSIRYVTIDGPESVGMTFVMPSKDLALLTFWCSLRAFPRRWCQHPRRIPNASSPRPGRRHPGATTDLPIAMKGGTLPPFAVSPSGTRPNAYGSARNASTMRLNSAGRSK